MHVLNKNTFLNGMIALTVISGSVSNAAEPFEKFLGQWKLSSLNDECRSVPNRIEVKAEAMSLSVQDMDNLAYAINPFTFSNINGEKRVHYNGLIFSGQAGEWETVFKGSTLESKHKSCNSAPGCFFTSWSTESSLTLNKDGTMQVYLPMKAYHDKISGVDVATALYMGKCTYTKRPDNFEINGIKRCDAETISNAPIGYTCYAGRRDAIWEVGYSQDIGAKIFIDKKSNLIVSEMIHFKTSNYPEEAQQQCKSNFHLPSGWPAEFNGKFGFPAENSEMETLGLDGIQDVLPGLNQKHKKVFSSTLNRVSDEFSGKKDIVYALAADSGLVTYDLVKCRDIDIKYDQSIRTTFCVSKK